MHDAMFADQSKLDEAALVKTAESLGMDQKSFESCLQSGKYKQAVEQDVQAGSRAGVNATPTFIINGEFLSGIKSVTDLTAVIDRQLSTLASKSSTLASR
jgi:predicted DsbA family dithiol-disulfide isomerase